MYSIDSITRKNVCIYSSDSRHKKLTLKKVVHLSTAYPFAFELKYHFFSSRSNSEIHCVSSVVPSGFVPLRIASQGLRKNTRNRMAVEWGFSSRA